MRTLNRNLRSIWYCTYAGETEMVDTAGYYTGETAISYDPPVEIRVNVSPATGQSEMEMFGNLTDYDRVIVTHDTTLPIDENTVLYIDNPPNGGNSYDYIVRRVAKSINSIAIAVRKVDVSLGA